jgi:hypothetical protein
MSGAPRSLIRSCNITLVDVSEEAKSYMSGMVAFRIRWGKLAHDFNAPMLESGNRKHGNGEHVAGYCYCRNTDAALRSALLQRAVGWWRRCHPAMVSAAEAFDWEAC